MTMDHQFRHGVGGAVDAPRRQQHEPTPAERAAQAGTVARNLDNYQQQVTAGISAMAAAQVDSDPAAWERGRKQAENGLKAIEQAVDGARAAQGDAATPDVAAKLGGAGELLSEMQARLSAAPARPERVAPTLSCAGDLLGSLPPDEPVSNAMQVYGEAERAVAAVFRGAMLWSDIQAFGELLASFPAHPIARRFARFGPERQQRLQAILKDSKVRARARAMEAARQQAAPLVAPPPGFTAATIEKPPEPEGGVSVQAQPGAGELADAASPRAAEVPSGSGGAAEDANGTASQMPADPVAGNRGPGGDGIASVLQAALPGAANEAGPVPHQREMEESFGADFSNVRARTGATELRAQGAEAVAHGGTVAFADATPAPALVAHELTHVVQQDRAGGDAAIAASGDVSDDAEPAEREARDVAAAVDRGERASSIPITAAPAARFHRSPEASGQDAARRDDPPRPSSVEDSEWRRLLAAARNRSSDLSAMIEQSAQLRGALDETMRAVEKLAGEDFAYTLSFRLARAGIMYETSKERRLKFEKATRGAEQAADREIAKREANPALAGQLFCDISEGVNKQQGKVGGEIALSLLQEVQSSLVPAYRSAVDSLDAASAYSIGTQLLLGLRAAEQAQRDLRSALSLPVAPATETDAGGTAEQLALMNDHILLSQRMQEVDALLTRQMGPNSFRGITIVEGAPPAARVRSVSGAAERETSTTISLLASIETILGLANATRDGLRVSLAAEQRRAIASEVEMWRGRPVNYAFLRHVLQELGVWVEIEQEVAGTTAAVDANSEQFGAFADVGNYEESSIVAMLSRVDIRGPNGNPDAGEERGALRAFDMIAGASPDARAGIVLHLRDAKRNRGAGTCLDHLMRYLPGQLRERLAELVMQGHGPEVREAFKLIQPHYINQDQQTTMGDVVGDGWLATGYDVLTGGAYSEIVAAQEARREGLVTDGQAGVMMRQAGARGVGMTAMAGAFGEVGGIVGGKLAQRFGGEGLMALLGRGAVTGAGAGIGGQFGADLLDQASGVKNGWSSPGQYATAGALGAGIGVLAAGVSVAAGRHLPPEQRTPPQQMAANYPEQLDVIETLAANPGRTVKIRVPRRRATDLNGSGIIGGPIPAFEGGAPAIAAATDAADDFIVIEVAVDAQLGAMGGPLGQYVLSSRLGDPDRDVDVVDYMESGRGRDSTLTDDDAGHADAFDEADGYQVESIDDLRGKQSRQQAADKRSERKMTGNSKSDAKFIRSKSEPEFDDWFDSLTSEELGRLLDDAEVSKALKGALRGKGGNHEWLMVAEAEKIKSWGVRIGTVKSAVTRTEAVIGRIEKGGETVTFRHGGEGSHGGTFHRALRGMIDVANDYGEFLSALNRWADDSLAQVHSARWPDAPPLGRYSLPDDLQLRGEGNAP